MGVLECSGDDFEILVPMSQLFGCERKLAVILHDLAAAERAIDDADEVASSVRVERDQARASLSDLEGRLRIVLRHKEVADARWRSLCEAKDEQIRTLADEVVRLSCVSHR